MMRAMRVRIVCPAPRGTLFGNRISALRWARILRELGHRVVIETEYDGADCDLLIALHAKRSANAVLEGAGTQARRPVPLMALTGTDLYRDIQHSRKAQRALEIAARLVVLQPLAAQELAPHLRDKVRVIYQSVEKTPGANARSDDVFQVCVVGHLRSIKDPLRAALAAR